MQKLDQEASKELAALKKRFFLMSILVIAGLFACVLVLGIFYGQELHNVSEWVYQRFGFWPMCLIIYFSDTFISPFPPDLFLVIIANSDLRENWFFYLSILSICSTAAGFTGWFLGRSLYNRPWVPSFLKAMPEKHKATVEKFGTWSVTLGALTPFPFSLTCWSAGFLKMPLKPFAIGAFMRFPRIFIYYWAIESALWVPKTF